MSLSRVIAPHLPFLRRYARALTGTQGIGDAHVKSCLEAIIADPRQFQETLPPKIALYQVFHTVLAKARHALPKESDVLTGYERRIAGRLQSLTPQHRQALLLTALEDFSTAAAATILMVDHVKIQPMIDAALKDIHEQLATNVLIIEDEPIISLDLTGIVEDMGHHVMEVATTRDDALAAVRKRPPGLVLADIQLADGSSGIDAVRDILQEIAAPIIFITAFPDRLLTGERPEPTFLITKPFQPDTVKAAIGQALFFVSVEEGHDA